MDAQKLQTVNKMKKVAASKLLNISQMNEEKQYKKIRFRTNDGNYELKLPKVSDSNYLESYDRIFKKTFSPHQNKKIVYANNSHAAVETATTFTKDSNLSLRKFIDKTPSSQIVFARLFGYKMVESNDKNFENFPKNEGAIFDVSPESGIVPFRLSRANYKELTSATTTTDDNDNTEKIVEDIPSDATVIISDSILGKLCRAFKTFSFLISRKSNDKSKLTVFSKGKLLNADGSEVKSLKTEFIDRFSVVKSSNNAKAELSFTIGKIINHILGQKALNSNEDFVLLKAIIDDNCVEHFIPGTKRCWSTETDLSYCSRPLTFSQIEIQPEKRQPHKIMFQNENVYEQKEDNIRILSSHSSIESNTIDDAFIRFSAILKCYASSVIYNELIYVEMADIHEAKTAKSDVFKYEPRISIDHPFNSMFTVFPNVGDTLNLSNLPDLRWCNEPVRNVDQLSPEYISKTRPWSNDRRLKAHKPMHQNLYSLTPKTSNTNSLKSIKLEPLKTPSNFSISCDTELPFSKQSHINKINYKHNRRLSMPRDKPLASVKLRKNSRNLETSFEKYNQNL